MLDSLLDAYRDARDAFWKVYLWPPYDPNDLRPLEQRVAETRKAIEAHVAELSAELAAMTANRDECANVFGVDREHQLTGPIANCACPSCELHLTYRSNLRELDELKQKVAELEARLAAVAKFANTPHFWPNSDTGVGICRYTNQNNGECTPENCDWVRYHDTYSGNGSLLIRRTR